jgi:hypothetical protein
MVFCGGTRSDFLFLAIKRFLGDERFAEAIEKRVDGDREIAVAG